MITAEIPVKSIKAERRGLEVLLVTRRDRRDFILGAIAVLNWIEHGGDSPLAGMSPETADAVLRDVS